MTTSITIPERHLVACLPHAGKKESRNYLNSVAVEVSATGQVICIGTDGSTMLAIYGGTAEGVPAQTIIVPRDVVARIKPGKRRDYSIWLIPPSGDFAQWRMVTADWDYGFTPIDHKYPDWRASVPSSIAAASPAQFNPELLMRFLTSQRALSPYGSDCHVTMTMQGPNYAALVGISTSPEVVGVVMPLRASASAKIPGWLAPNPSKAA